MKTATKICMFVVIGFPLPSPAVRQDRSSPDSLVTITRTWGLVLKTGSSTAGLNPESISQNITSS